MESLENQLIMQSQHCAKPTCHEGLLVVWKHISMQYKTSALDGSE
jgi:hypothetical protein